MSSASSRASAPRRPRNRKKPSAASRSPARPAAARERFVDSYLAYLLTRASKLVAAQFHERLEARRIPAMHWRILIILRDGPLSVKDLAEVALNKQPTVSRNVDRMERLGWVARSESATDRRSVRVSLTPAGRRQVRSLMKLAREHEAAVLKPFGREAAATLLAVLRKLIALHASPRA